MSSTFDKLSKWPTPEEIEFRPGPKISSGYLVLAYVDARYVMDALDKAGVRWQDKTEITQNGKYLLKGLGVWDGDEWIWHWDGVEIEQGESKIDVIKTAESEALRRVGVHHGIARKLYDLPRNVFKVASLQSDKYISDSDAQALRKKYAAYITNGNGTTSQAGSHEATPAKAQPTESAEESASAEVAAMNAEEQGGEAYAGILSEEEIAFLHEHPAFSKILSKKDLESGVNAGNASFMQLIESKIGRSSLGWFSKLDVQTKDKDGKERKAEWIEKDKAQRADAQRALDLWHKIETAEASGEVASAEAAPKSEKKRTEKPDFNDEETCEKYLDQKMTDGDFKGKTMREVVGTNREWVEKVYVQQGNMIAAKALGYDFAAAKRYDNGIDRQEFVDTHKRLAAKKAGGKGKLAAAAAKAKKATPQSDEDAGYDLFMTELKDAIEKSEGQFTMESIEQLVKENCLFEDGTGKTLKDLTQEERDELIKSLTE